MPLVSDVSSCTRDGTRSRTKWALRLIFFHCAMSDLSSRFTSPSVRSSATVRTITPPDSFAIIPESISLRRLRSSRLSILRLTPTLEANGMYTRKRPASEICRVTRGPLVLIGSLVTCTRIDWFRLTRS